jgi:hypothetical protein
MNKTNDKPSSLNQEPAEGSRDIIEHELEREGRRTEPKQPTKPAGGGKEEPAPGHD